MEGVRGTRKRGLSPILLPRSSEKKRAIPRSENYRADRVGKGEALPIVNA